MQDRICRERAVRPPVAALQRTGEAFDLHTGYYDPKEDKKNNEEDRYTGWWYVSAD